MDSINQKTESDGNRFVEDDWEKYLQPTALIDSTIKSQSKNSLFSRIDALRDRLKQK